MPRPAIVIAALAFAATSVAPGRAQTPSYVLFPAGHQPASPKNEITFSAGSSSTTYELRGEIVGGSVVPISELLLDTTFLDDNTKIRITPQSVSPAAFAAVYGASGAVGSDVQVEGGIFEGEVSQAAFILRVRYDASAQFTDAQSIGNLRWGTPRIEIYEGATVDPALTFAWSAHGTGTRTWGTGDPVTAYRCLVAGDAVSFSAWPSAAGEDSTLFRVTPGSTSTSAGNGRLNLTAPPDYETPTDSGGDNLYKVRVRSGHSLNDLAGEGQRTGCDGSALELTVLVKDAGPPAPVRSLAGDLDSDTMTISVNWDPPAGFLDGSDSNVVVPFDTARMSGSGPPGTAVAGYDYEYRLHDSSTWTQDTTTATSFEIPGVSAGDAYTVRVRARNAEGAGAPVTIDVPRAADPPRPPDPPRPSRPAAPSRPAVEPATRRVGVMRPMQGGPGRRSATDRDGVRSGRRPPDVRVECIGGCLRRGDGRGDGTLDSTGGDRPGRDPRAGLRWAGRLGVGDGDRRGRERAARVRVVGVCLRVARER